MPVELPFKFFDQGCTSLALRFLKEKEPRVFGNWFRNSEAICGMHPAKMPTQISTTLNDRYQMTDTQCHVEDLRGNHNRDQIPGNVY